MHKDHPIVVLISAEQEWRPVLEHYHPANLEATPYGECFEVSLSSDQALIFLHGGWGKIKAADQPSMPSRAGLRDWSSTWAPAGDSTVW